MPSVSANGAMIAAPAETADAAAAAVRSYAQILKSSAMIGGASVVNIAVGIVRAKAMAIFLGPSGVGLAGLYGSIADLSVSIAGMGINSSGVRQIADAAGSGDTDRIARTAKVLRRTSVLLAALGAILLVLFASKASILTFGSRRYAPAVALLSTAVFLRLVSGGQEALIQGMRRISDLAKMSVLTALIGTLVTIPLIYLYRERGVVPALISAAAIALVFSLRYATKIRLPRAYTSASQTVQEAAALLKLGSAFMASSLMMMGSAYIVKITILRHIGFDAAGLYQAAWTLGGLYVGFILQAMGADFYPRLTACAADNAACNRMVNEQARMGLLLGGPGVLATLTFAPVVIGMLYTPGFQPAVGLLRWICLGAMLRVINWPMGFIILAKGKQTPFFWSELTWAILNVGMTWLFVTSFALNGAGIAFFVSYVIHGCIVYAIVRRLSGFRWSPDNKRAGVCFLSLIAVVFCGFHVLPVVWGTCIGLILAASTSAYSAWVLRRLIYWPAIFSGQPLFR